MSVDAVVTAVIDYLKTKHQLELLPQVAEALTRASFTQTDPNLALVKSVVPLTSGQKQALKQTLNKIFKRPIRLKTSLDSGLIAGLKITLAGKVIDVSLSEQLTQLNEAIVYD